ncbi:hypothetical protein L1987_82644 [Smallanthus sonchifolius]|uniref:Uncharacterized protein n=1 Tax=Smallanthus sonchifolius TaxID=185202 RepID=A0ACB8YAU8_9ASTR|nr:hypothetical protein L1987_82644 [Smallanthus sonchifolius]
MPVCVGLIAQAIHPLGLEGGAMKAIEREDLRECAGEDRKRRDAYVSRRTDSGGFGRRNAMVTGEVWWKVETEGET